MMRDAFGQAARIDEDERRLVRIDQVRQAAINFLPNLVRHHGLQRRAR